RQPSTEAEKYPEAAVTYVRQQRLAAPIFNYYDWGGYLIWKLYPTYRVYIDGRADVYGDTFIENFLDVYRASANWEKTLGDKDVQLVLIEPDAPLATALAASPNWAQVFADSQSVIYEKK